MNMTGRMGKLQKLLDAVAGELGLVTQELEKEEVYLHEKMYE